MDKLLCACGKAINRAAKQLFITPLCDQCLHEERELIKLEEVYERG